MPIDELKKELLNFIENTDDESLLALLKEDFVFYGKVNGIDITDELSDEQLKELTSLSAEDEMKDTDTWDEFKTATGQWRTK